jgi:translation elongation factor EF-Ts
MNEEIQNERYWLEEYIDILTDVTNRSKKQTIELYNSLGKNIFKLIELEQRLISNYNLPIPTTKEEYDNCMKLSFNENSYRYNDLKSLEYLWYYSKYHLFYPFSDNQNFQKMIVSNIQVPTFLGHKAFHMTSKDNNVSYYLKIATESENMTLNEELNEFALKLLQQSVQNDYYYRYQIVTDEYDDDNLVINIIDDFCHKLKGEIRVEDYRRLESIPENNQFFRLDYMYPKNYFGVSALFSQEKDVDRTLAETAGKLVIQQLISTRPLVIKEEQILNSVREGVQSYFHKSYAKKYKDSPEKLAKIIEKEYNSWLDKAVLYRQKIEFDDPGYGKTSIQEYIEQNKINLVKYIAV